MRYKLCVMALLSVASAISTPGNNQNIKRQTVQNSVPLSVAAMTDPAGNVIQFDTKNVYLDMKAKGL